MKGFFSKLLRRLSFSADTERQIKTEPAEPASPKPKSKPKKQRAEPQHRAKADSSILTDLKFGTLDLDQRLIAGLNAGGFEFCTPIQQQTLPLLLEGRDVAGEAQTGTGKTAAYLLAALHRILNDPSGTAESGSHPRGLIIAPTRELAIQIHKDAELIGAQSGLRLGLVYGGVDYEKQRTQLGEGVDLLIGTPGRIIDYYKQNVFSFKQLHTLVLDEADRMFDLGFIKDIRYLLRRMPPRDARVNMLFSATLSHRVSELAYEHMNDPEVVSVAPERKTADKVLQKLFHVSSDDKLKVLVGLLQEIDPKRTLVFVNTKRAAFKVEASLNANGFEARTLSGDVAQKKRQRLIEDFSAGRVPIVVATDVAARGLHIPDVSHVINYDVPQNEEDYVHRIGRTARAGEAGDAITLACEEYVFALPQIESYIGHKINVEQIPDAWMKEIKQGKPRVKRDAPRRQGRGRGGSRQQGKSRSRAPKRSG
ncbi:MAG: DEAD/DEAH box helicase [Pseudomonadota bacterium]